MSIQFKNRTKELGLLEKLAREKKPKLVILYGRRRVGKTELLNEFARRHKALYLLARQEPEKEHLKKISEEVAAFFKDSFLEVNPFQNYDALFIYLAKKEIPIFFDEFPYLVESNKALPSILQEHWDKYFSKKKSFIVLCGSSIMMMESLLGHRSPLYGRRTEQLILEPLKLKEADYFFPKKLKPEEKISYYAVLGGTPAYLLEFDYAQPLIVNLKENILKKNKFLYQDTSFVIQQELREPRIYYSIIKSIAKGNTKIGNIVNEIGIGKEKIIKYLGVLQNLQLVERRIPITEKRPEKSRKGLYFLKDNYFKFWFRFVFENKEYIEQNKQEKLVKEKIMPELNSFIGDAFEKIALEWIKEQKLFDQYLFGQWWDKTEEIDLVGIDKSKNKIVFGEVKWKDLSQKQAEEILRRLKEKSNLLKWGENPEKRFILIAKGVKGQKELMGKGDWIFTLKDLGY